MQLQQEVNLERVPNCDRLWKSRSSDLTHYGPGGDFDEEFRRLHGTPYQAQIKKLMSEWLDASDHGMRP